MKLLSKYKKQPEGEELDRLFEETLEDMMLPEEKRKPLRVYSDDRKWLFIQTQMKQNIQGNFTVISTLDILNSVFYSFSSLFIVLLVGRSVNQPILLTDNQGIIDKVSFSSLS